MSTEHPAGISPVIPTPRPVSHPGNTETLVQCRLNDVCWHIIEAALGLVLLSEGFLVCTKTSFNCVLLIDIKTDCVF